MMQRNEQPGKKAWIGIGISNEYISVLKNIKKTIRNNGYSELIIIVADEIDYKYNSRERKQLVNNLFELAFKIKIPNCKLKVAGYKFLYSNKEYLNILKKYKNIFDKNSVFKNKVICLVKQNRQGLKNEKLIQSSGYVLEEISTAIFFKNID